MRVLMVCRLSGRKISMSCRLVMRSVFEGGVGCMSGGMAERSMESGDLDRREAEQEDCGVLADILRTVM